MRTENYLTIACQISYSVTIKIFKFGIEEHMTSAVIHQKINILFENKFYVVLRFSMTFWGRLSFKNSKMATPERTTVLTDVDPKLNPVKQK